MEMKNKTEGSSEQGGVIEALESFEVARREFLEKTRKEIEEFTNQLNSTLSRAGIEGEDIKYITWELVHINRALSYIAEKSLVSHIENLKEFKEDPVAYNKKYPMSPKSPSDADRL